MHFAINLTQVKSALAFRNSLTLSLKKRFAQQSCVSGALVRGTSLEVVNLNMQNVKVIIMLSFALRIDQEYLKEKKVCDASLRPLSNESHVVSTDTNTNPSPINHVGVALSRPDLSHEDLIPTCCVLQTAKVQMCGNLGQRVTATVLFDSGLDRSYVSSSLLKKIKPKWVHSESLTYSTFGNKTPKGHMCNIYDLTM